MASAIRQILAVSLASVLLLGGCPVSSDITDIEQVNNDPAQNDPVSDGSTQDTPLADDPADPADDPADPNGVQPVDPNANQDDLPASALDRPEFLAQTSTSGAFAGLEGDLACELAVGIVFDASELNGGVITLTGTMTQTEPGSEVFTYSPQPADKLVVVINGGQACEITFAAFEGHLLDTWEEFLKSHTNLAFNIKVAGESDLDVQSVCYNPAGEVTAHTERRYTGTTLIDGLTMAIDLAYVCDLTESVDYDWAQTARQEKITGTTTSALGVANVDESQYSTVTYWRGDVIKNFSRAIRTTSTYGGVTYTHQDVGFATHIQNGVVVDSHQWAAQGQLLEDGQVIGEVLFASPVANGGAPPHAIIRLTNGETIPLE